MQTQSRLRLVEPTQLSYDRARFAKDRQQLLARATAATGRNYFRPLDALQDIVRQLFGFRIERRPLPGDRQFGEIELHNRRVILCSNLYRKLTYPATGPGVEAFTLAHELAHLRLHIPHILAGRLGDTQEREANVYAGVFLIPRRQLVELDDFLALRRNDGLSDKQIDACVQRLAVYFGCNRQAMIYELVELGVARMDWQAGELSLVG